MYKIIKKNFKSWYTFKAKIINSSEYGNICRIENVFFGVFW
jgi:hypothetical protein